MNSSSNPGILQNIQNNISNAATTVSDGITQGLDSVKSNVNQAVSGFSSPSNVQASSSFLDTNTIVAKFSFLILAVVVFFVLFNLGVWFIGYLMMSDPNPYLIKGMINAERDSITIYQDPRIKGAIPIPRSNNQFTGIEFTWSCWLLYSPPKVRETNTNIYEPVFIKGDNSIQQTGYASFTSVNNAPGVYIGPSSNVDSSGNPAENSVWILMDTIDTVSKDSVLANNAVEFVEVEKVPIEKFFHLAIRCQNKFLDIYINGTVVFRKNLVNVPKQNYYDLLVCPTPGFNGQLSDLRYFSRALTVVDINGIVLQGPNMNAALASSNSSYVGGNYLSTLWYNNFLK